MQTQTEKIILNVNLLNHNIKMCHAIILSSKAREPRSCAKKVKLDV